MVYFTFATQFIIRHLGGSNCKLLRNISTIPFRDPEVRQTCENKYERYVACLGNEIPITKINDETRGCSKNDVTPF